MRASERPQSQRPPSAGPGESAPAGKESEGDWSSRPLYLPLLAIFPVLSLFAGNAELLELRELLVPLLLAAAIAALAFGAAMAVFRERRRAALVAAVFVFWSLTYGHWHRLIATAELVLFGHPIGFASDLGLYLLGWLGLLAAIFLTRKTPSWLSGATAVLNVVFVVLVLLNGVHIGRTVIGRWAGSAPAVPVPARAARTDGAAEASRCGDIYYLVLDAYGRSDVLADLYGYDNGSFREFLRENGFYVAERGRANYVQTLFTLASALNFEYLDDVAREVGRDSRDRAPLADLVRNSRMFALARSHGYQLVTFDAMPWHLAKVEVGDLHFDPPTWTPSAFWGELLGLTALTPFLTPRSRSRHREDVLYAFRRLGSLPPAPARRFVFFHVLTPHQPFVMDSLGRPIDPGERAFHVWNVVDDAEERAAYVSAYRQQAIHVTRLVREAVERILANRSGSMSPVIVIQGDHGPASRLDTASVERTDLRERLAILNAVRIPGYGGEALRPDLSPVNTMRIVADHCFGADLAPLRDRSFFSTWGEPYRFVPVADSVVARGPSSDPPG